MISFCDKFNASSQIGTQDLLVSVYLNLARALSHWAITPGLSSKFIFNFLQNPKWRKQTHQKTNTNEGAVSNLLNKVIIWILKMFLSWNVCHGRFSFKFEGLIIVALSYAFNPLGTSDLLERKIRVDLRCLFLLK